MLEALYCKEKLGEVRGAEVIDLVERTTGQLCPCKQGYVCPLLPAGRRITTPADV